MKSLFAVTLAGLLSLALVAPGWSQGTNATVSGTVQDASGALIPGVEIVATNDATGVATTILTNASGAYNIPSLLPGTYTISASLPGFQTQNLTDIRLGLREQARLNFTLQVAGVNQAVEVTAAAGAALSVSSQSVGGVIADADVQALPTINNNVMDVYRLIPGINVEGNGVRASFAGLDGFGTTNIVRDGVDAQGGARWTANALTATHMSPELIGEVQIVVAPVDAEMGRGNAQIQFMTRSGTNEYHGSAVWNVRNSALDANTWNNNNDTDPVTGAWSPTKQDWANVNNYSLSMGGPIVENRTFFFALWDQSLVNGRTNQNPQVLTPCARNGIFRYFDNWNNGNALQTTTSGGTPTISVVDGVGNPLPPATNPDGTAHNGTLRYVSVFGPVTNIPTQPDCSDAVIGGAPWDTNRVAPDPTGFVGDIIGAMPLPNNYEIGDGLNLAGHRWVRSEKDGTESIFALSNDGLNRPDQLARKQINVKIDHNFNPDHTLAATYTYEHSFGTANFEAWPGGFRGSRFRRPQLLSTSLSSVLSPNMVNEARVGWRRTGGNSFPAIHDPNLPAEASAFFREINGYPVWQGAGAGGVNFQNTVLGGGTSQYNDVTNQLTYADTLSWSRGVHSIKFGGELRRNWSRGYDAGIGITSTPRAEGGDAPLAQIPTSAIDGTAVPGLAGSTSSGNNQRLRQLLSFHAGSLDRITQFYYMQDPTKLNAWEDFTTFPQRVRETHRNEVSFFVKDDWKVTDNLTLNVGLRWDWYGSIYDGFGLMPLPTDGYGAVFGVSGRTFEEAFWQPGERAPLTVMNYVGKNSPNPDTEYFPNDFNNFGPAVGFAYRVPWLSRPTTVRGGYQVTYNGTPSFNSLTQINNTAGSTFQAIYEGDSTNEYLDFTDVASAIPVPTAVNPMQDVPLTERQQTIYVPHPDLTTPYVQNITFSITHNVTDSLTLDLRYLGVLGRKQWNVQFQLNEENFLFNGLKEAFDAVRMGNDTAPQAALLDQIFDGINLAGSGFGPVGTVFNGVQQTAGLHLRAFSGTRANLANGIYENLASTLNNLNYSSTFNPTLPAIPEGVNGQVLRHNGFPENFIKTNPQFANAHQVASINSNNYHALVVGATLRPTQGVNFQSTYTWSKNLGVFGEVGTGYTNPIDRDADYALLDDTRVHDLRTMGTFQLPLGPGRLLFGNSTGVLARIAEGWTTSWIVTLSSGAPMSLVAQDMLYDHGTADIVGPFDRESRKVEFRDGDNFGTYFGEGLHQVPDPQCGIIAASLQSACTMDAIADASGQILLQNPYPGERGTTSQRWVEAPGVWRYDGSFTKRVTINEAMDLQIRLDAINVFNHPQPSTPIMNINNPNFGLMTGANAKSEDRRQFQASVRLDF